MYDSKRHRFALAVLAGLMVIIHGCAQTSPSTAHQRNFQMALWVNNKAGDADIGWFNQEDAQPAAPTLSVLTFFPSSSRLNDRDPTRAWNDMVSRQQYDFSRIVAVIVDEPYLSYLDADGIGVPSEAEIGRWPNPCRDRRLAKIREIRTKLQSLAQAVKKTSPRTRFWINFSEPELQWMMDTSCPEGPLELYGPFADVISLDKYQTPFAGPCTIVRTEAADCVQPYYDWLRAHIGEGQQIALVPGTYVRAQGTTVIDDAKTQASLLSGYFEYAQRQNEKCNRSIGSTGRTGNFDKCLVWIVAGFTGESFVDGTPANPPILWRGMLDSDSSLAPIQQTWRAQRARAIKRTQEP